MLPGNTPSLFAPKSTVYTKTVYLTDPGIMGWMVPPDWSNTQNTVECVGAGAGGWGFANGCPGGGGGAYSKSVNLTLTALAALTVQVGAGGLGLTDGNTAGGDTWFNSAAFPTTGQACGAKGGALIASQGATGAGGAAASGYATGTGSIKSSGGTGAAGSSGRNSGSGGGGAGGPRGNGGNGAAGAGGTYGGGGGGSGGGTAASTSDGGDNADGVGGGNSASGTIGPAGTQGGGGAGGVGSAGQIFAGGKGGDFSSVANFSGGGAGGPHVGSGVSNSRAGSDGGYPGGGGSGAGSRSNPTLAGGKGGDGGILITYAASNIVPTIMRLQRTRDAVDGTSHVTNIPPHDAGDLLVVLRSSRTNDTAPSGWTKLITNNGAVFYRYADGTEPATVNFTSTGNAQLSSVCLVIRGGAASAGIQGAAAAATTGQPNPPSLSPAWGAKTNTLWLSMFRGTFTADQSAVIVTGPPTNHSLVYVSNNLPLASEDMLCIAQRMTSNATEDPGVFTMPNAWPDDQQQSYTVAIRSGSP